jgi:hypothetical protein
MILGICPTNITFKKGLYEKGHCFTDDIGYCFYYGMRLVSCAFPFQSPENVELAKN